MDPFKEPLVLASTHATELSTQALEGLVAYLSRTHVFAREKRVRIDTVDDHRFVVMDPLVGEDECLAYGFVRNAAEAYVAGWDGAMSTVTMAGTGW